MEENPYQAPKPAENTWRPEQLGSESRRNALDWCGVAYIVFGLVALGALLAPDLRNKHWAVYPVVGAVAVWFIAAGRSLMKLSKATYFLALPLAVLMVVAVPVGPVLSAIVGYCLFKEARSVFGSRRPTHL